MAELPSGTVTFLFTDIEGSTALWERDRTAMATAVECHLALLRDSVAAHNGAVFKVVGDAVQAAFPTAPEAVAAALDAQRGLAQQTWPEQVGSLPVRMALHTAAATPRDGDYLAAGLNRLARLLAAAHGGQVILSLATQDLARDALPLGACPSRRASATRSLPTGAGLPTAASLFTGRLPTAPDAGARPNNLPLQPTPFLAGGSGRPGR